MDHFHFPRIGRYTESERRLIHKFEATEFSGNDTEKTFREKNGEGAQEFVDKFFDEEEVSDEALQSYLDDRMAQNDDLTDFEQEIQDFLEKKKDITNTSMVRRDAEEHIQSLFSYLKKRRVSLDKSKKALNDLSEKSSLPYVTDGVFSKVKSVAGSSVEIFNNASTVDKGLMLAGTAGAVALAMLIYSKMKENAPGATGLLGTGVGLAVGGTALYMAYEATNRTVEKVRGVPLTDWHNGGLPYRAGAYTKEEWKAHKNEGELKEVAAALKQARVPQSFVEEITTNVGNQKTVKGIANISTMDVMEFQQLYEEYKEDGGIPIEAFPGHPCPPDPEHPELDMTPVERFVLMQEIGKTTGLIDENQEIIPPAEGRKDKSMLYLMLDWEHK